MKIGYFINQYPKVSHSFIRREILALEARGNTVRRYALTSPRGELVDPEDLAEQAKTEQVFRKSPAHIAKTFAWTALARPRGMLRAIVSAIRMGWRSDRGLVRHFAYVVEAAVVAEWCRRDQIQHLHAHFGTNSAAVALLVHQMDSLPYSFTVHGPDEFDCPEFIALGEKIRCASFVVAVSWFGRSQLMRWVEPDQWRKINVVHCGLDRELQAAEWSAAPKARFACVGRLDRQKGHLVLIDAAQRLREGGADFQLVLVGDGPLRSMIEHRIASFRLEKQVTITGWVPWARVKQELESARALILASFAEGLPVVIMEAMAMKRPVIATNIAGVAELVVPGETGWLVPAGDECALADAMRSALSAEPAEITRMGEAAHRRVFERHDIGREVAKLESLMRSSLNGQRYPWPSSLSS